MAPRPLIFALANPNPGDHAGRGQGGSRRLPSSPPGRTDYPEPDQQRALLSLRLPRRARCWRDDINEEMKAAAVTALAALAESEASDVVLAAYRAETFVFGPDYILPKPFDPRLIIEIAPAVAKAAMEFWRRDAPDRGFRRLPGKAHRLRLPLGLPDEADHGCGQRASRRARSASYSPRAITPMCCRPRSNSCRAHGAPDPGRPAATTSGACCRISACA